MNITKIISKTFDSRLKQIDLYANQASEIQHRVLNRLVQQAARTEWGKKYDYASIRSYEDFRKRLPIQTYEEIKALRRAFTGRRTEPALAVGNTLVCQIIGYHQRQE